MDYKTLGLNVRRLEIGDKVDAFDCQDEDLNDFILNDAANFRRELLAVTYVVEDADGKVMAYYSLANDKVAITDFASSTEFNRFRKKRFPNEKRLRSYPAAKLCRLAVDVRARGLRFGTYILDDIVLNLAANREFGCRFLTVDAYLAAVPFYLKYGFAPLTAADEGAEHTRLLYFDLKALL